MRLFDSLLCGGIDDVLLAARGRRGSIEGRELTQLGVGSRHVGRLVDRGLKARDLGAGRLGVGRLKARRQHQWGWRWEVFSVIARRRKAP